MRLGGLLLVGWCALSGDVLNTGFQAFESSGGLRGNYFHEFVVTPQLASRNWKGVLDVLHTTPFVPDRESVCLWPNTKPNTRLNTKPNTRRGAAEVPKPQRLDPLDGREMGRER